jgi:HSP20 family protein
MEEMMKDFFDDLGERWLMPWERERPLWRTEEWGPAIESHVEKGNLIVKADLPGIDPKDVSISVTGNQLTIEGERKQEKKEEKKDYDADKVKASYKDGVLQITMPAPKELAAKRIQIEAK